MVVAQPRRNLGVGDAAVPDGDIFWQSVEVEIIGLRRACRAQWNRLGVNWSTEKLASSRSNRPFTLVLTRSAAESAVTTTFDHCPADKALLESRLWLSP